MLRNTGPDISKEGTFEVFTNMVRVQEILNKVLNRQKIIKSIDDFPDGMLMKDMSKAVKIFTQAVTDNKKIKFICDSDADGLGTYILWWYFFKRFPYRNIEIIITNRKEGYGFIERHINKDVGLYITSDNGITALDATHLAKKHGAEVIITDHHQPDLEVGLPKADAIIDPYQPGCPFPYKDISGTFVLWFFIKELIKEYKLDIDPLNEFIFELGLTTISDVMPIDRHINRFVVTEAINRLQNKDNVHRQYMRTFLNEKVENPTAEDLSFGLIPALNATQRMTTADHAGIFMTRETDKDSKEWFKFINDINQQRKDIQQQLYYFIKKYFQKEISMPFIVIPGEFHKEYKGVQGIIAGKLAEEYNKPALVLSKNNKGIFSGSGRSSGDLDILNLVKKNSFVSMANGHKQALGIEVQAGNIKEFVEELQQETLKIDPDILKPSKLPLGFIPFNALDLSMYYDLKKFEPFGKNFPKPTFVTRAYVSSSRLVGKDKNHLMLVLTDREHRITIKGMKFFTKETCPRGEEILIYFNLNIDTFGKEPKLSLMIQKIGLVEELENINLVKKGHSPNKPGIIKATEEDLNLFL